MRKIPPEELSELSKRGLTALHQHLIGPTDTQQPKSKKRKTGDGSGSGSGGQGGQKSGDQKSTPSPFSAILRRSSLPLTPQLEKHINDYGYGPSAFFTSRHQELDNSSESDGFALALQYKYTKALEQHSGMTRLRKLFMMIMWHDLAKLAKPSCTGNRIGHLMEQDLMEIIKPVWQSQCSKELSSTPLETVSKELKTWCTLGAKLMVFVNQFGEGCLFYLEPVLSNNFLLDQLRASGQAFDEAIRHLRGELALEDKIADPANAEKMQLAKAVRGYLIKPFQDAKIAKGTVGI
jgi:hypothetical protein